MCSRECGGLTPSSASIRQVSLDIPVRVIAGEATELHIVYNASERSLILSESMDYGGRSR